MKEYIIKKRKENSEAPLLKEIESERKLDIQLKINEALISNLEAVKNENERVKDPTFFKRAIKY